MEVEQQLTVVEQKWPAITQAEIAHYSSRIVSDLGVLSTTHVSPRIVRHSHRPMAAGCEVDLGPDLPHIFVKRYLPALYPIRQLQAQHDFTTYLHSSGFPTPPLVLTEQDDGEIASVMRFASDSGEWIYEATYAGVGEDRYRNTRSWAGPNTLQEAHKIGQIAGMLANVSENYPAHDPGMSAYDNRFQLLLSDPLQALPDFLESHPAVKAFISTHGYDIESDLDLPRQLSEDIDPTIPQQWTHGDLHCSNMLWDKEQVTSVIDFGLAAVNPRIFDLAIAIERHAIDWLAISAGGNVHARHDIAAEIISGYLDHVHLTAAERASLAPMLALTQVEAGLHFLEYYAQAPVDASIAHWSYNEYFRGHTAWFVSRPGQQFLSHISQCVS
ncbi:phosphotransferase enzyme family protein [Arcanobacterium pinnipediorum]|uniref:Phosphotransferase n=1 Tax=Arcanobacterium pinnipediorum TaxID=1503041 RepID=A0ABY5AIU6_9ACTO|nr:phosphotransferase [Arcanobacterium pinnipediorum]USR79676.1 phosphotransferase [Arcanobacterium pinnipediorum]